MLWELLDRRSRVDPEYPCAQHVDDLSHVMVAETESELKAKLLAAGRLVGSEVKRLKLKLSDKSTLLPDIPVTRSVAKQLSDEGIPMKTCSTCDDVGIQMIATNVRRASTLNTRITEGG